MSNQTTANIQRAALMATSILGRRAMLLMAGLAGAAHAGGALPSGGTVAAGAATISAGLGTTTITQTSDRAVLNWNSFSVGQGNNVNFNQPGLTSAILNRVTGTAPSSIAGSITSNGAVYLVNPNGIAITSSGTVNTAGGFVASTLDIADTDFMSGNASFSGKGASGHVSNAGSISAGQGAYVALLGGSIANSGTINVPYGRVGLGSGEQIALDLNGNGFMQVAVPTSALTGDAALIDHAGSITASGGIVQLKAATVIGAVRNIINLSGNINADSATGSAGNITLLGGADTAHMGGTVTVNGTLSARATGPSGDGGTVETSGATVDFAGLKVDTTSFGGKTGNWLVDPPALLIDSAAATTISANLATSNVTIQTNSSGTSSPGTQLTDPNAGASQAFALGDILIAAPISWASSNTLFVLSFNNITISAAITAPAGTLNLNAGNFSPYQGVITDTAAVNIGTFLLQNGNWVQNSAVLPAFSARDFQPSYYSAFSTFGSTFLRVTGGAGSASNPYQIADIYGLQGINSGNGSPVPAFGTGPALLSANYVLVNNIDASGTVNWNNGQGFLPIGLSPTLFSNPISFASTPFTGSLNGQGYSVIGLVINNPASSYVGLFSQIGVGAIVSNLNLSGGSITGNALTRSFLQIGGLAGANAGTITLSSSTASVSATGVWANYVNIGGLVGFNSGTVDKSFVNATVSSSSGYQLVGGLVGNNTGSISNSYARGTVGGANDSADVGGLVGDNSGSISVSYALTDVHTASNAADGGGLAGKNYSGGTIVNSYAGGNVTADLGATFSGVLALGGLVGGNYSNVSTSYALGKIVAAGDPTFFGGLVGLTSGGVLTNTYWNTTTSGRVNAVGGGFALGNVAGGTGLTNAQMTDFNSYAANFVGFDFANIWAPPAQTGQAGQTGTYLPALYALSRVVVANASASASRAYGTFNPVLGTITSGGPSVYAFGPSGDTLTAANIFSTAATTASSVGNYTVTANNLATSTGGLTYRVISSGTGNLTITPAPLTVTYTANPLSRLYGAANGTLSGTQSASGLVNGDTLAGVTTGTASYTTMATMASNVGSYGITGSGLSANSANYTISFAQAAGNTTALSVTPRPLTVSANLFVPLTRFYGDANVASLGAGGDNLVNGDQLGTGTLVTSATPTSNVGVYDIKLSNVNFLAGSANNYAITYATTAGALSVTPRPLTITPNPIIRTYGAANPATDTALGNNLVNGDSIASIGYTTPATSGSAVGQYNITGNAVTFGSGLASNYAITYATNLNGLSINPAPLTVTYTANPLSRLYGAANGTLSGTQMASGLVNGDTLSGVTTGTASYTTMATMASNVGSYGITGSGLSANSANYTISFAQAAGNATALSVTPAPLTVTYAANPLSRLYGAATGALSGTQSASGLVNNDTLAGVTTGTASFTTMATMASNVGSYGITGSGLSANSANYTISFAQAAGNAAALSVTPAPLIVTYTANPVSRLYGAANGALSGTQMASGLVNGDTLSGVTTGTASYTTMATMASNVGSYGITGSGLSANSTNYTITFTQAAGNASALSVTPAPLTVTYTANPLSHLYGAANGALSGTQSASGLVNGDTLTGVTTGTASYTTTATNASNVGNYAITGSGLAANSANYSFTFAQAAGNANALSVTPAALTVTYTANPIARLYGVANPAMSGTQSATGLVNGDTLATVTSGTASYAAPSATATSNIGTYAIMGSGLTGSNSNYTLSFVQAASNATALSINPAALSVTANPLSRLYGAANPTLTYTSTGLVNGDTLSGALATTATQASNVGGYAITQGTLAATPNYTLNYTGATLSITPAPLTVTYTANPLSRVYGNTNGTLAGTQNASGLVNNDTLISVTTGTAAYATTATTASNVGNYGITGSGLSANSSNYSFTFAQAATNATALSVTARPLTVTANPLERAFAAANPPLTYVITPATANTGLVNGDTLTGGLSTTAVLASPSGSYPILQGTLAASSNYTVTYVGASLKVNLPPVQSLNAFLPQATPQVPTPPQNCTPSSVAPSMRENDQIVITGGTSCTQ